jgi:hypothetical protein
MPLECSVCGLNDQIMSVDSLLSMSAFEQSRTTGLILDGEGVTPLIATTNFEDTELDQLQTRIKAWIETPLASSTKGPMYRKSTGWIITISAWFWSAVGVFSESPIFFVLAFASLATGIWFLATLRSRAHKAGWTSGSSSQRDEVNRRRRGWYCRRCNHLMPSA